MDPIAVYGAVVASAVAVWNVSSELAARKPRLRVEAFMQVLVAEPADIARLRELNRTGGHQPLQWRCDVSVVNVGRRPVHIARVELRQSYAGRSGATFRSPDWEPCRLEPGQAVDVKFVDDDCEVDLGYPVLADANTDDGFTFSSRRFGVGVGGDKTVVVMPEEALDAMLDRVDPDRKRIYRHEIHDPT